MSDFSLIQCPLPYRPRAITVQKGDTRRWCTRINCDGSVETVSRIDALRQVAIYQGISTREAEAKYKRGAGLVATRFCQFEF